MPATFRLTFRGAFSLHASAEFGFGPNVGRPPRFDGALRLAFPVDGGNGYAEAIIRQDESDEGLQRLNGLGPFYAGLVVLRASGFTDALLPMAEPKVLGHTARYYGLDGPPGLEAFARLAEPWRPFRTWATVLIRLAGERGTELAND